MTNWQDLFQRVPSRACTVATGSGRRRDTVDGRGEAPTLHQLNGCNRSLVQGGKNYTWRAVNQRPVQEDRWRKRQDKCGGGGYRSLQSHTHTRHSPLHTWSNTGNTPTYALWIQHQLTLPRNATLPRLPAFIFTHASYKEGFQRLYHTPEFSWVCFR